MIDLNTVIEGCKQGNKIMQKELYERYSPRFYALCRRYASDDEAAREILVDGFISVFDNIGQYRAEGSFEGWMQTIFLRQALKTLRCEIRQQRTFEQIEGDNYDGHYGDVAEQIDIHDAMVLALQRLTDEERVVFNLMAVEEYSIAETSEALNILESTVKSRYYRALEKVKQSLTKRLGENYLKKYK